MFTKKMVFALVALVMLFPVISFGADVSLTSNGQVPGQPFDNLQNQINSLTTQINNLSTQLLNIQQTPGPQGPAGPAGPQGPAGSSPFQVVHGAVLNGAPYQSTGFTVSNPETGLYYIAYAKPFTTMPHCVAQPNVSGDNWAINCVAVATATNATTMEVECTQALLVSGNSAAYPLLGFLTDGPQRYSVFPEYGYQGYTGPYNNACSWGNCFEADFSFICAGD